MSNCNSFMSVKKTPTEAQIGAVMAALGRRNAGRHKTMTPAALRQRRLAAKASVAARTRSAAPGHPGHAALCGSPIQGQGKGEGAGRAQSKPRGKVKGAGRAQSNNRKTL